MEANSTDSIELNSISRSPGHCSSTIRLLLTLQNYAKWTDCGATLVATPAKLGARTSQSLRCNVPMAADSARHDGEEGLPSVTRDRFHQSLPPTDTHRETLQHEEEVKEAGVETTPQLRHTPTGDIYMYLPSPQHLNTWTRPQAPRPRLEDDTH